jgi:hypothetical protein
MNIEIFEPELIARRGFNGFHRYYLSALVEHAGARPTREPRPRPRLRSPREHESAWIRCDDALIFFDMSDHVQLIDIEALRACAVYFKANWHPRIAERILRENGAPELIEKMAPFTFFSEGLDDFARDARRRRLLRADRPRYDICFVMGVYENPFLAGGRSPFVHAEEPMTPAACHFWVRAHVMESLRAVFDGYYRLTSRANPAIEDGTHVQSNISRRAFSRRITDGRITAVCTLPHAVFPWKVSESFVLGRPILLDREPITAIPDAFRPRRGEHYLTLFEDRTEPDLAASWDDPRSYRVLPRLRAEDFRAAAEAVRDTLADRERLRAMGEACRTFAERVYRPESVAAYICDTIRARCGVK